jgi:hypothetical protein
MRNITFQCIVSRLLYALTPMAFSVEEKEIGTHLTLSSSLIPNYHGPADG